MAGALTRRDVIAGAGASALALSTQGLAAHPRTANGVVFEDAQGDGVRRPGSRGIAGVMVSNGRDVTLTSADGSWDLPIAPGDGIFVIKPPQWTTPLSTGGIPRFSYLFGPVGVPTSPLAGDFPLGPLPPSLDFPLRRQEERDEFDVLLVSDTQPENAVELGYVRDDIAAAMLGVRAAFGINHGDVVADNLSLYPRYLQVLAATGIPWHHCPGNHDLDYAAETDSTSRETWKRVFGARHYAFQHAGATFLVLDNVEYLGQASGRYRGAFGARQLAFVRNVLRNVPPEQLVVLSMHIPLRCYLDPTNPADSTADFRSLLELLSGRAHTVSFAGHLHASEHHYLGQAEGFTGQQPHHHQVLTAASGSWWSGPLDHRGVPFADSVDGTPNGFHVLTVSGSRCETRFVPAVSKPPAQIRVMVHGPHIHAPARLAAGSIASSAPGLGLTVPAGMLQHCHLIANVFDGGPKTRVVYEIAGRSREIDMQMTPMADPLIANLYTRDTPRKDWVHAVVSSHIWKAPLPSVLPPCAHALIVRAWDEHGREHVARAVLEVVA